MNAREAKRTACAITEDLIERALTDDALFPNGQRTDDEKRIAAALSEIRNEMRRRYLNPPTV